jgi:hypothetical protein
MQHNKYLLINWNFLKRENINKDKLPW